MKRSSGASGSCTTSGSLPQNVAATYTAQNQILTTNAPGFPLNPPGYDGAGDVTNDGKNQYLYDAEGRICAVSNGVSLIGYLYDAAGNRVAKGSITSMSCDITSNGFTQDAGYVVGLSGEQLTEVGPSNEWLHTNVYAGGKLIATYEDLGGPTLLHFHIDDPLGTRRAQATSTGVLEAVYPSLPFGDALVYPSNVFDPTENHFTGKERDMESGNDYFLARYYNSATGRFLSPDWSAKEDPVPYAKLDDPQSLNLYGYMYNNPLDGVDPDGHQGPVKMTHAEEQQSTAMAYSEDTNAGVDEDEAIVSTAVNRVNSGDKSYVAGTDGNLNLTNVINAPGQYQGVSNDPNSNYQKSMEGVVLTPNATKAVQAVENSGVTTDATNPWTKVVNGVPVPAPAKKLRRMCYGGCVPATPSRVGNTFLYKPPPKKQKSKDKPKKATQDSQN